MELSGLTYIIVEGHTHALRFNLPACTEFERRMVERPTQNTESVLINLVYAGVYGECEYQDVEALPRREVIDILTKLASEKDKNDQVNRVWKAYYESTYGRDFVDRIQNAADNINAANPMIGESEDDKKKD